MKHLVRILLFVAVLLLLAMCIISIKQGMEQKERDYNSSGQSEHIENEDTTPRND